MSPEVCHSTCLECLGFDDLTRSLTEAACSACSSIPLAERSVWLVKFEPGLRGLVYLLPGPLSTAHLLASSTAGIPMKGSPGAKKRCKGVDPLAHKIEAVHMLGTVDVLRWSQKGSGSQTSLLAQQERGRSVWGPGDQSNTFMCYRLRHFPSPSGGSTWRLAYVTTTSRQKGTEPRGTPLERLALLF